MRLEERLIQAMRADGLIVTEAIEEQVYVERFNMRIDEASDFREVFQRCKRIVTPNVEAETKPLPGEIQ